MKALANAALLLAACAPAPAPVAAPDPCAANLVAANVYDLNCSFSLTGNPTSTWQYGFASTPDSFALASHADTSNPVGIWHPDGKTYYPYVAWNSTPLARVDATDSWAVRPREVAMEAAPDGTRSVVRFIAPQAGSYRIEATFEGIHFRHSTTDVHIRAGGVALFDADIDGYAGFPAFHSTDGMAAAWSGEVALQAGDAVSFSVGVGKDGANANDTTGLMARVSRL